MKVLALAFVGLSAASALATIPSTGYSSFLGGRTPGYGNEHVFGIAVDGTGNAFAAGSTDAELPPGTRMFGDAGRGGFVTKISPDGTQRLFTSFFRDLDLIALKIGPGNQLYVLGMIGQGPQPFVSLGSHRGGHTDAVLLKLDPNGDLLWARYHGGSDLEIPRALALDPAGNAYLAGYTTSTNLLTTSGAAQPNPAGGFDGFVAKVSPQGELIYSTYLGGPASENLSGIAVDSQGRALVCGGTLSPSLGVKLNPGEPRGTEAFAARLNPGGTAFDWISRFGGESRDSSISIALSSSGEPILLGVTESTDFPVTNSTLQPELSGSSDLFLARLSAGGQQLLAATYLGGNGGEDLGDPFWVEYLLDGVPRAETIFPDSAGLAVAPSGEIYLTARSNTPNWPALPIALSHAGNRDGFLARVNANLTALLDLQFIGSASDEEVRTIALDSANNAYLGGTTYSPSFQPFLITSPGAFQPRFGGGAMDGFVVKIPAAPGPLANDAFAGRTLLSGARASGSARIDSATLEPGEPAEASLAKSVWFSWRAPATGRASVYWTATPFDGRLKVFAGSTLSSLTPLADTENTTLVFPVQAQVDYHFALLGGDSATGVARLSIALSEPPNDAFADAALLTGFPVTADGSNVNSTAEPGEPNNGEFVPSNSVWWKWTAPETRSVSVTTAESTFDTALAIYSEGQAADPIITVATGQNISQEDRTDEAIFLAQAGRTYFISVNGPRDESGAIRLRILSNEPPPNDNFTNAVPLTGFRQQVTASNSRATLEPLEPMLTFTNAQNEVDSSYGRATVWWRWQAPESGRVRIDTLGSDFDTRLGVYRGGTLAGLALVASHDDLDRAAGQRASLVEFESQAGTTYSIQVDGSTGDSTGVIRLNLRLTFPPRILSVNRTPEGQLRLRAQGTPGTAYRSETASDLRTWTPGATVVSGNDGTFEFTLPLPNNPRLFIRLAAPE